LANSLKSAPEKAYFFAFFQPRFAESVTNSRPEAPHFDAGILGSSTVETFLILMSTHILKGLFFISQSSDQASKAIIFNGLGNQRILRSLQPPVSKDHIRFGRQNSPNAG